ncbi:hypothetical protein [Halobacillus sp. BBL2006]|uniref:hypothetical protein n=1 Tax=Halobacillus sp. BBL2006 TaxID=1543706 RepID=UPI00054349B3|nr:hypothetical protein [Halobacillus sp. BBL2006]KHE72220.1 hypothetical protein LD39_05685 [Halobacillus sp. BBL2006]
MNTNICRYCYKEIQDRDELVTASNWFRVRPYHYRCFELLEQDTKTIAGTWTPVNGVTGIITIMLMLILSVVMFTTNILGGIGDLLGILAFYPVFLRIFSYFVFEIRLPKYIENKRRH